jgi:hypothetical protein
LVGKLEGKRLLGRPNHRWENYVRMNLREIGWEGGNWIYPAQDRDKWRAIANTVMNLRIPQKVGNFLTI